MLSPIIIIAQSPKPSFAFKHVNVVDVKDGSIKKDFTVVIIGNRITAVGKNVFVSKNTEVKNASGKYLIPGLWDMHYHSPSATQTKNAVLPLMLANGITGIRKMWGTKEDLLIRDSIRQGLLIAPIMIVGSPLIDGAHSVFVDAVNTDDPKRIPFILDSLHSMGYDFMKSYEFITNDVFYAISAYCHSHNLHTLSA